MGVEIVWLFISRSSMRGVLVSVGVVVRVVVIFGLGVQVDYHRGQQIQENCASTPHMANKSSRLKVRIRDGCSLISGSTLISGSGSASTPIYASSSTSAPICASASPPGSATLTASSNQQSKSLHCQMQYDQLHCVPPPSHGAPPPHVPHS